MKTTKQVAKRLTVEAGVNVRPDTLIKWIARGHLTRPLQLSREFVWRDRDIAAAAALVLRRLVDVP